MKDEPAMIQHANELNIEGKYNFCFVPGCKNKGKNLASFYLPTYILVTARGHDVLLQYDADPLTSRVCSWLSQC